MSGDGKHQVIEPGLSLVDTVERLAAQRRQAPMVPAGVPPAAETLPVAAAGEGEEEADAIPDIGDPYRAHGRLANKPELMLGFIGQGVPLDAFAYADLRRVRVLPPLTAGEGLRLVLRFVEAEVTQVELYGRNLLTLADHLRRHRVPWIRELPAGRTISDPVAVVITRMVIGPAE